MPSFTNHPIFRLLHPMLSSKQCKQLLAWQEKLPAVRHDDCRDDCTMQDHPYSITAFTTGKGPIMYIWTNIDDYEYALYFVQDEHGEYNWKENI